MEDPSPSPETEDHLLTTTTTHLSTLLTTLSSATIHHFKSKWSLITTKLHSLHHLLSTTLSPPLPPLSSTVLSSLSSSLSSASSLLSTCSATVLPAGKLLTLSNLDSLSSSLHRHLSDLHLLTNSSTTTLTRLQIGTSQSKSLAMDNLIASLQDDKHLVASISNGLIPVLVKSLDNLDIRDKAIAAIARVSTLETGKTALINEGLLLLNHLIRVIESGTMFAKEKACIALHALSSSRENARTIGCRGGVSSLLEICHGGTPTSQGLASGVLRNLANFDEIKENFVEENAVPVLIALSGSGTVLARENSIGCLSNLVSDDDSLKVLVAREGGVEALRSYWDSVSTPVGTGLEPAVEMLRNLASYRPIGEVLIAQGFAVRLIPLLNCGVMSVRIAAAKAVYEFAVCSKARREMGEAGGVAALVRMLDGKAVQERESSARALSRLLQCTVNKKLFKKEERGIVGTVQLLDPLTTKNLDKKWPVAVLATLVHSKKCRKQMVGTGACVYLQKLVESDVEGSKKLLESLGRGKIWGVFARP